MGGSSGDLQGSDPEAGTAAGGGGIKAWHGRRAPRPPSPAPWPYPERPMHAQYYDWGALILCNHTGRLLLAIGRVAGGCVRMRLRWRP